MCIYLFMWRPFRLSNISGETTLQFWLQPCWLKKRGHLCRSELWVHFCPHLIFPPLWLLWLQRIALLNFPLSLPGPLGKLQPPSPPWPTPPRPPSALFYPLCPNLFASSSCYHLWSPAFICLNPGITCFTAHADVRGWSKHRSYFVQHFEANRHKAWISI